MVPDVLATQGARTSETMILTLSNRDNLVPNSSHINWLKIKNFELIVG